jgi:hypothetical protein
LVAVLLLHHALQSALSVYVSISWRWKPLAEVGRTPQWALDMPIWQIGLGLLSFGLLIAGIVDFLRQQRRAPWLLLGGLILEMADYAISRDTLFMNADGSLRQVIVFAAAGLLICAAASLNGVVKFRRQIA